MCNLTTLRPLAKCLVRITLFFIANLHIIAGIKKFLMLKNVNTLKFNFYEQFSYYDSFLNAFRIHR